MRFVKYAAISTLAFALAATAAPVDGGSNQVAAAVSPQQAGLAIPSGVSGPVDKVVGTATNTVSKVDLPQLTPEQQQTLKPVFDAIESLKATAAKDPKTSADIGNALETIHDQTKKIVGTANDRQIVASIFSQVIEALVPPKIASPGAASHAKRDGGKADTVVSGIVGPIVESLLGKGNIDLAAVVDNLFSPNGLVYKVLDTLDQVIESLPIVGPLLGGKNGLLNPVLDTSVGLVDELLGTVGGLAEGLLRKRDDGNLSDGGDLIIDVLDGLRKRDDGSLLDDLDVGDLLDGLLRKCDDGNLSDGGDLIIDVLDGLRKRDDGSLLDDLDVGDLLGDVLRKRDAGNLVDNLLDGGMLAGHLERVDAVHPIDDVLDDILSGIALRKRDAGNLVGDVLVDVLDGGLVGGSGSSQGAVPHLGGLPVVDLRKRDGGNLVGGLLGGATKGNTGHLLDDIPLGDILGKRDDGNIIGDLHDAVDIDPVLGNIDRLVPAKQ